MEQRPSPAYSAGYTNKFQVNAMVHLSRSFRIPIFALGLALAALAQPRVQPKTKQPVVEPKASWLDPDRSEPAGTHFRTFKSQLAKSEVSYLLYLPPDYETAANRRYPVVYWLHGLHGDYRRGTPFVEQLDANIRAGKAPAMIAVLVNGMVDCFYNDSPDGKWPVESVIIKELIPHVDSTYRTIPKREARAVEGFSMGGYGAAHLGFKYPEVFGFTGVMAGAIILIDQFPQGHRDIYQRMFGGDKNYFAANDPMTLVRKNADAIRGKMAIRVAIGDKDGLLPRSQELHELLGQLKIGHEYELVPGVGHNTHLFYTLLGPRAFAWYQRGLSSSALGGGWSSPGSPDGYPLASSLQR
jgi:endo-1,4-beta-xylanase